jgi:hypothetical protein
MSSKLDSEKELLEVRKVESLEKIADSLDALTLWVEEIDKEEWGDRIAWYLDLWKQNYVDPLNKDE